jgi:hypothetical protein
MPKYVVYYKNIENGKPRAYVKIERHPLQEDGTAWITSKSQKISIEKKLEEAKKQVEIYNQMLREKVEVGGPLPKIQKKSVKEKNQKKIEQVHELIEYFRAKKKFPSYRSVDPKEKKMASLLSDIRKFERQNSERCYVLHRKLLDESGIPWKT